jgi:hypothetical protein
MFSNSKPGRSQQKAYNDHIKGLNRPKSFADVGTNIPGLLEQAKKIKPKDVFMNYSSSSSSLSKGKSKSKSSSKSSSSKSSSK